MDTPAISFARQVFSLGSSRRMGKEDVRGLQVHKSRTWASATRMETFILKAS